jgi:hypothetical protein
LLSEGHLDRALHLAVRRGKYNSFHRRQGMYLSVVQAVVLGEVARVGIEAAVGIDFVLAFDSAAPGLACQYIDAVWLAVLINLVEVSSGACPLADDGLVAVTAP